MTYILNTYLNLRLQNSAPKNEHSAHVTCKFCALFQADFSTLTLSAIHCCTTWFGTPVYLSM